MSVSATCPHCGHAQELTAESSGRAIACTSCGSLFRSDNPYATPASLKELPAAGGTAPGQPGTPGVINFDQGLSRGFNLYTSKFGALVLVSLVFCAVQFGVAILQQIPIFGVLVALVAPFTITAVVTAGFNLATLRAYDGGEPKVDDLFVEFRYLTELALLVLVQVGIWMAAIIPGLAILAVGLVPLFISLDKNPEAMPEIWQIAVASVGGLILIVTGIVLTMGFLWSYVALVDRRAGFWDAIRTSWTLTRNNPAGTFGILLVGGLAGTIGVIACLFGIIFTLPIYHAMVVAAYRSAMPAAMVEPVPSAAAALSEAPPPTPPPASTPPPMAPPTV